MSPEAIEALFWCLVVVFLFVFVLYLLVGRRK